MPTGLWLYSYVGLWGLLIIEAVALRYALRAATHFYNTGAEAQSDGGLPPGAIAPAIERTDLFGRDVRLPHIHEKKTLIHFVSPGCPACKELMLNVGSLDAAEGSETVLVVGADELKTKLYLAQFLRDVGEAPFAIIADAKRELFDAYHAPAVPYTVLVGSEGRVRGAGHVTAKLDLLSLVRRQEGTQAVVADRPGAAAAASN